MRDNRSNDEQVKIELLSQWKLEAESRNVNLELKAPQCSFLHRFCAKMMQMYQIDQFYNSVAQQ